MKNDKVEEVKQLNLKAKFNEEVKQLNVKAKIKKERGQIKDKKPSKL